MLGHQQFVGFIQLEDTLIGSLLVTSSAGVPINADALPTYRVYGPSGFLTSGSCTFRNSGSITGATNASPIVVTSAAHGLTTGARVTITGVGGNTAANTTAVVTEINANTFSLDGVAGNGAYTSGGTWNVTGLYKYTLDCIGSTGFERGELNQILFAYAVSSVQYGQTHSFNVN
jgi:hypothetical protein